MQFRSNVAIRNYFEQATVQEILSGVMESVDVRSKIMEILTDCDPATIMFDADPYLQDGSMASLLYQHYKDGDLKVVDVLSPNQFEQLLEEYDVRHFGHVELPIGLLEILIEEMYAQIIQKHDREEKETEQILGQCEAIRAVVRKYEQQLQQFISLVVGCGNIRYEVHPIWKRGPITVRIDDGDATDGDATDDDATDGISTAYASLEDFSRQVLLRKYIKVNLTAADGCCHYAAQWSIFSRKKGRLSQNLTIKTSAKKIGSITFADSFYDNLELCRKIPEPMLQELLLINPNFSYSIEGDLIVDRYRAQFVSQIRAFGPWDHYYDTQSYLDQPSIPAEYHYAQAHLPHIPISSSDQKRLKYIHYYFDKFNLQDHLHLQPTLESDENSQSNPQSDEILQIEIQKLVLQQILISLPSSYGLKYGQSPLDLYSTIHWLARIFNHELGRTYTDATGKFISLASTLISRPEKEISDIKEVDLMQIGAVFKYYFEHYDEQRAIPHEGRFIYPQAVALQDVVVLVRLLDRIPASYLNKYGPTFPVTDTIYASSFPLTFKSMVEILTHSPYLIGSRNNITPEDILQQHGVTVLEPESWALFLQHQDQWLSTSAIVLRSDLYTFLAYIFQQELGYSYLDLLTQTPITEITSIRSKWQS